MLSEADAMLNVNLDMCIWVYLVRRPPITLWALGVKQRKKNNTTISLEQGSRTTRKADHSTQLAAPLLHLLAVLLPSLSCKLAYSGLHQMVTTGCGAPDPGLA